MVNKQRRLLIRCDHEGPGGSYSFHTFEAVAAPTVDATRVPPATVEPCEPSTGASPALLNHYWSYFPASAFAAYFCSTQPDQRCILLCPQLAHSLRYDLFTLNRGQSKERRWNEEECSVTLAGAVEWPASVSGGKCWKCERGGLLGTGSWKDTREWGTWWSILTNLVPPLLLT